MKFALVGLGSIGRVRMDALRASPGHALSAVCDADPRRLAAAGPGVRGYASFADLAASDDCDAIIISTPPNTHESLALAAFAAGKHVLVEKPMANSLEACRRMLEAAEHAGRLLAVGFNQRYFDAVKVLRAAVQSGAIGTLTHLKGFAGHTGLSEFSAPWMYDKDTMGGGALCDNGVHMIDLVAHVMGDVTSVYGVASNAVWRLPRVEDNAFAILRGPGGQVGTLHASWTEWKGYHFYLEAYGDRGMARAYYAPMTSTVITMDKPGGKRSIKRNFYPGAILREKFRGWQTTAVRTFQQEFDDFEAVAADPASPRIIARGRDGYRALAVAEAVYESTRTGVAVPVVA